MVLPVLLLSRSDEVALIERLSADGLEIVACRDPERARAVFQAGVKSAILIATDDEPNSELELLRSFQRQDPTVPVLVLACANVAQALEHGAYYATRVAWTPDEVSVLIKRALGRAHQRPPAIGLPPPAKSLLGDSAEMQSVRLTLERLATWPTGALLLIGESGTGKRTAARLLHDMTFPGGEFVELSATRAASQLDLVASARQTDADRRHSGMTLFTGEIADLPLPIQHRLLHLLQPSAGMQMRLVASSSRDLARAARDGLVRPELAYRFPATIELPPLRRRTSDVPLLARHFLTAFCEARGRSICQLTDAAAERLIAHSWPGNVRELANVMARAVLVDQLAELDVDGLPELVDRPKSFEFTLPAQGILFDDLEREVLTQALKVASGNQTRAAALLGLTRDQMRYRMAKFNMVRETARPRTSEVHLLGRGAAAVDDGLRRSGTE